MVSENRKLSERFDEQLNEQKLHSLRQLAYGLSHELNNPLANISTRAQLLRRKSDSSESQRTLDQIVAQAYRGHGMIADLMFYANPPEPDLQRCEILSIVRSVIDEFESSQSADIRFQWQGESECHGNVDAIMIGELIRALVRNSVEAIGESGLVIASVRCDADTITVQIADSGPGLSESARRHAFDPYFSGREAGRGLGLGLCRAYRIAQIHQGTLSLAGGPAGCVATLQIATY